MIRKIKILGLALVAVTAATAITGAGAQAAQFHATTPNTAAIVGNQTTQHQFSIDVGIVKCTQALFEGVAVNVGELQTTFQDWEATGQYTGCTISGIAAVVHMNGCRYTFTGTGQPALTSQGDITGCTAGKVITITAGPCTITVPEQNNLSHSTFTNVPTATPHDVQVNHTVTGVTYQTHGTCPNTMSDHTSQTSNGAYTGSSTARAQVHMGAVQATHNGHTYQKPQGGAVVGLIAT